MRRRPHRKTASLEVSATAQPEDSLTGRRHHKKMAQQKAAPAENGPSTACVLAHYSMSAPASHILLHYKMGGFQYFQLRSLLLSLETTFLGILSPHINFFLLEYNKTCQGIIRLLK